MTKYFDSREEAAQFVTVYLTHLRKDWQSTIIIKAEKSEDCSVTCVTSGLLDVTLTHGYLTQRQST